MRGKLAKRIRKHVRTKYKFMSAEPLYRKHRVTGQLRLSEHCQRILVQHMKKEYKRRKHNAQLRTQS